MKAGNRCNYQHCVLMVITDIVTLDTMTTMTMLIFVSINIDGDTTHHNDTYDLRDIDSADKDGQVCHTLCTMLKGTL